ncbi:glycosyltransferase family 4 protein [Pontibacter amylolyticus]|uniref:Glycosyl transferase n=1 Tax=Pontibacter amylolyticus TaxID=1424080 RepID=A0ABQ1WH79_9BACT|nr:glycosyltransferase family 4 protein [Pontibacter amylolyticus]GGG28298.1 glycosyl transferase [Pontibacter amylolyticus]
MSTLKILVVGPSIERTKGGMSTVINNILHFKSEDHNVELQHLVTHVEGRTIEKLRVVAKALLSMIQAKFDIMHIHVASDISIFRKSLFVYLCLVLNKPIIMHIHGGDFDTYYQRASPIVKYYIGKTLLRCHKIIVLSQYYKSFLDAHIKGCNIEVLYNGVCMRKLKDCQTAPFNLNGFLFLGKLCKLKGVYDLLEAIDILVNKYNQGHLRFLIAGQGDTEQVRSIIDQKKLSTNVQLLGWINDKEKLEWLRQVDSVVLPSYVEALPMSIIEAMGAGKVIISTRVGGIPELVKQDNGFLINPGDIDSLCNHILYVISHPEQVVTISNNNINKTDELYNLDKINARLFDIYFEIAGRRKNWEYNVKTPFKLKSQPINHF